MAEPKIDMSDCIRYLALDYPVSSTSVNVECPVCGNDNRPNKKKLNIDYRKNAFRCNRCGFQGGVYDFWAYHRGLTGNSMKSVRAEAAGDIEEFLKGSVNRYNVSSIKETKIDDDCDCRLASKEKIDEAYRSFLELLTLNDNDRDNLRQRGLTDDAINRGGYKSMPETSLETYCNCLLERGLVLQGVPGFFRNENDRWTFRRMSRGFLVPSLDLDGSIQGMQLRVSDKTSSSRYLTLSSSGMKDGTKGRALPHFNPGDGLMDSVVLTEGSLKGNIISELTGYPVIAVLGVNSICALPGILISLRDMGMNRILIAYDMDRFKNHYVLEAQQKLKAMLHNLMIPFCELVWNENEKGLDDYIASTVIGRE